MCMKEIAVNTWKPAVVGAVIVFVWSAISWMALPYHETSFSYFKNEAEVAQVLEANAPEVGVYLLPHKKTVQPPGKAGEPPADMAMEAMKEGPFMYGAVRVGRNDLSMTIMMIQQFILDLILAAMLCGVVFVCNIGCWFKRFNVMKFGILSGVLYATLANSIWWEFPWMYTIIQSVDMMIGWGLAAFVMAKMIPPLPEESTQEAPQGT